MLKRLELELSSEDIEGQIDRLNYSVQNLLQGVELSAMTPRNPSQLSISHKDWQETEEDISVEINLPLEFEAKLEELLLSLDRSQMLLEDLWSETYRKENTSYTFDNEAYILKLEKENMELRSRSVISRSNYSLNLKKNSSLDYEKKNFEEKLMQLDKLNEIYHQKNQDVYKTQENLKVKEKWIEHKERELKLSWQNFEKVKHEWEQEKNSNSVHVPPKKVLGKPPIAYKLEIPLNPPIPLKPEASVSPLTPSSRQKSLDFHQEELKSLEKQLSSTRDPEESSKLIMKIDQVKNKIATLRGQKALFESSKSSKLITSMMKTMEKEVSYEENKRKQLLEKFTKKNPIRPSTENNVNSNINLEAARRFLSTESISKASSGQISSLNSRYQDKIQVINLMKENINKRERELLERELRLQETWMKIPGSKELIEVVNLTLSKLTEQKRELDNERESFEAEKVELFKLRDKVMESMNKININ
jgi:hypothetical protein